MWLIRRIFTTTIYSYAIAMILTVAAQAVLHKYWKSIAQTFSEGDKYWFTVRRNNKMGLSNVTMLTDTQYAFSLILSEAVKLNKKNGGGWLVSSSKDIWEKLLRGVEVQDDLLVDGLDLAEVSTSKVQVSNFVEVAKGSKGDGTRKPLLLVRLRQRVKGETVVPSKQLSYSVQPPANQGIRQQQKGLSNDIASLFRETWIELKDNAEEIKGQEMEVHYHQQGARSI